MTNPESLVLYLITFAVSTFFFSFYKQKNKTVAYVGIILAILIPTFLAGLRYNVGTDYPVYHSIFETTGRVSYDWILTDSYHLNEERGFLVIVKFVSSIIGVRATFGFFALVIVSIFVRTILTQYRKYNLTLLYFMFLTSMFLFSFNGLRQQIAMVILFWGLKYVFGGKPIKFVLMILVASEFHFTVVVALPIYFFWNHRRGIGIKMHTRIALYGATLVGVLTLKPIMFFLCDLIHYDGLLKYLDYFEVDKSLEFNNLSFLIKVCLSVLFLVIEYRYVKFDVRLSIFINMFVVCTILELLGYYSPYIKRISTYYGSYSELMLLGALPLLFCRTSDKLFAKRTVAVYELLIFFASTYVLNQGEIFPYQI